MGKQEFEQGDSNVVVRNQVVYGALPQDVIDRMGDTTLNLLTNENTVIPAINELKSNLTDLTQPIICNWKNTTINSSNMICSDDIVLDEGTYLLITRNPIISDESRYMVLEEKATNTPVNTTYTKTVNYFTTASIITVSQRTTYVMYSASGGATFTISNAERGQILAFKLA